MQMPNLQDDLFYVYNSALVFDLHRTNVVVGTGALPLSGVAGVIVMNLGLCMHERGVATGQRCLLEKAAICEKW